MIQSSLANGGDRVLSLTLVLVTHRVGVMTDPLLTDRPRPILFPIPRATGVPTVHPGPLPHPSLRLLQDARPQHSFRMVEGRLTKKRLGLSVVNSSRARMKAQGVSLAHSEAEVKWPPHQVHLIRPLTVIGGAVLDRVFHHTVARPVSL